MKPYAIGLYEKAMPNSMTLREKLACAKDCGYDFVEISIDETDDKLKRLNWTDEERLQFIREMKEIGLPVRSMCLSGHRKYPLGSSDPKVRARGMEIMEKAVILADDLGIRIVQLAGYDVYYEESTAESERLFRENLAQAVMMASARGIMLGCKSRFSKRNRARIVQQRSCFPMYNSAIRRRLQSLTRALNSCQRQVSPSHSSHD